MPESSHITLEQYCQQIKETIEDANLTAWVTAEVAQLSMSRGHIYISLTQKSTLSDAPVANLRCQIWARNVEHVLDPFRQATESDLQAGMKILALVTASFHPVYGLSAQILAIDPNYTLGDLERRRQEIWQRLQAEGVVEMNKSLTLPTVIRNIAVVSAATAAGYGDFCDQLRNNAFGIGFNITLFPAAVQGAEAEASVVAALNAIACRAEEFDVAVIIRGGGSKMDLACFDSYIMASNVAQFPLPVITGIGHERDTSIVDLVAHTQVKTPTAVAEFLIQHNADFLSLLDNLALRTANAVRTTIANSRYQLDGLRQQLLSLAKGRLTTQSILLDNARQRLLTAAHNRLALELHKQDSLQLRLKAIDPRSVLRRGFSMTTTADGQAVTSAADLKEGEVIVTHFADGKVESVVK